MSVIVKTDLARVHWLSNVTNNGVLTDNHVLLYVERSTRKLGQVTRDTFAGLTPQQAFETRYSGSKSIASEDIEALDLFVLPKTHGTNYSYDNAVRRRIHALFRQNKCPFDGLYTGYQKPGYNHEAMPGYDPDAHIEILLGILKDYCGLSHNYDTRDAISWRWKQKEDIEMVLDRLQKHQLCLFAAYTSRGKTKIGIEVAHRLLPQGGIVLVTTPITDTKKSFEENLSYFHFGSNRDIRSTYMDSVAFARTSAQQLGRRARKGELIFVVLTVQDLRYGEALDIDVDASVVKLREKYQELSGCVDLWIRDERHSQYNGFVTSKRLGNMKASYELDLTATPYNCYDRYNSEHVVSRNLLWGLQNRSNTRLPKIRIDAIGMATVAMIPELAVVYSQEEGYDPRKLFLRENQSFVMEQEIVSLAQGFYQNSRSRNKNPLSIVNDIHLSAPAKLCGMWVLPQGQEGDSANQYLPALAQLLTQRIGGSDLLFVDSYSVERLCPSYQTIGDYIESLIEKHRRVIILTCGKFLTGTDIPSLGHVVLMDRMESVANFEQLLGRMIREYPEKQEVKLYAMAPGTTVGVTLGRMARMNAEMGGGSETQVLDCIPLTEYQNTKFHTISVEEILAHTQEWFQSEIRDRLPSNSLLNALAQTSLEFWNQVDLKKLGKSLPKTRITDDNLARVRKKLITAGGDSKSPPTREEVDNAVRVMQALQTVVFEAQWLAFTIPTTEWRVIWAHPVLSQMFDPELLDACALTLESNPVIERMVDDHIRDRQFVYRNSPPEISYPKLFGNSKRNQDLGLVYVPFELAEEMVSQLP